MAMSPRLLRPRASGGYVASDADARAYISAVQVADASSLEPAVAKAIDDFVVGCKTDGIWSAIKASCILMGARTLSGALTPLVGTAPTNNNFVSGDYVRGGATPGLIGNGSTKFLNTNRADNADGQNDCHKAVWATSTATANFAHYIGARASSNSTLSEFYTYRFAGGEDFFRLRSATGGFFIAVASTGFKGMSRAASASFSARTASTSGTITETSVAPASNNTHVFATGGSTSDRSNARICFYSVGSALTLTLLESRVSTLVSAMATVT